MKSTIKGLLAIAAILTVSVFVSQQTQEMPTVTERLLQATTYTTTSTRSNNVKDLCPANLDRTTLVNSGDVSAASSMRAEVNTAIGIDGNKLIGLAVNGSTSAALEMVTGKAANYGIYVGSFLVGFVIFLIIWPFLCCCCCCPSCCPSKCCQKPEDEQYSKCELYWPTVTLIMALALTMGASIYGYTKASSFGPSISNMGCSVAIFVDDLLNGNVTTDGSTFFTGLNTLSAQINNLDSSLSNINTAMADLRGTNPATSDTLTALNNVNAAQTEVQQIPNPTAPHQLTLQYRSPLDQSAGLSNLDPQFKSVLGDYTQTSKLVGGLYTVVGRISTFISDTRASASSFNTHFGSVNGQISTIQSNINTITDSVTKLDNNLNSPLKPLKTAGANGNMGLQAFYGVLIGFSFFTLLGTLLTVCCDKYKCRYLMYFSCIFLFLTGLLSFLLSSLFSMFIPPMTWGCSYLDVALKDKAGFTANLGNPLGSNVADMISPCMSFGDGIIMTSLVSGGARNALNNLTSLVDTFNSYNSTTYKNWITGNMTPFMNTVRTWCRGQVVDVTGSNYAILQNIANPSYSSWTGCNAAFSSDSWVPSNSQNSSYSPISCQVSSGNVGDSTTCTATLTNDGANTCAGCMNSISLSTQITTSGTLNGLINTRYGGCNNFRTALTNIWDNYYIRQRDAYGPSATSPSASGSTTVLGRAQYANTLVTGTGPTSVMTALDTVATRFNTIKTGINSINSAITDTRYGIIAGLNCKVFGEDFTRISNIMCGSMYYNMYIMRYALGLSAYGVLFAMCCIVCTGVRHYKHGQRKSKVTDAFFSKNHDKSSSGHLLRGKE